MRLISLHEPWATLMALNFKKVETRDWFTGYRGPLAIHASKHGMSLEDTLETCLNPVFFNALQAYEPFRNAILPYSPDMMGHQHRDRIPKAAMKAAFPNRGKIVAVVNLKEIVPAMKIEARYPLLMSAAELAFGNYDHYDAKSGNMRHGWITEFIFALPEPLTFTSKQGLVDVPEDTRLELKRQWREANL